MKRKIISIILIIFTLLSLASCGGDSGIVPGGENDETVYDTLNRLIIDEYQKISIDISTLTNGVELRAKFVLTNTIVEYEIEQLNKLPLDGALDETSSFKSIISGTAKIENGQVVKLDGESVSLPSYNQLTGGFSFDKSNFKNEDTSTDGVFAAEVVAPSEFFGASSSGQDVTVIVEYTSSSIETVTVNYRAEDSTVKLSYKFTK